MMMGQVQNLLSLLQATLPVLVSGQGAGATAGQAAGTTATTNSSDQAGGPSMQGMAAPPRMSIRDWQRLNLKTFSGLGGAAEADDWLRYINKKFETMDLTSQEKVVYASQQLMGEPDLWWSEVRRSHGPLASAPTLEEFTSAFAIEYYPFSLRWSKEFEL